jgi:adenylate kinase family enzyme
VGAQNFSDPVPARDSNRFLRRREINLCTPPRYRNWPSRDSHRPLFWQPGWLQTPKPLYLERLAAVVAEDRWIIEGVNTSTLDLRLPRTDLLIWLERSRLACLWRVARRVASSYGSVRPDMAPGCPEQLPDFEFLTYIWTFGTRIAPRIEVAIDQHGMRERTVRLTSDADAEAWLATLDAGVWRKAEASPKGV